MLRDAFAYNDDPHAVWPKAIRRSIEIGDTGLVLGAGTVLVRMAAFGRRLTLEADRERLLALLSVVHNRPVSADRLQSIEAAAIYWQRGDKALANLRLIFADLPRLAAPHDAYRLGLAETLLDKGFPPRLLMRELGLDPSALDLRKYPGQPRIAAGNGRESGRFGEGRRGDARQQSVPPHGVQIAANGPLKPEGISVLPSTGIDPLDPQGLNKEPPSPQEQQAIVDTLNVIRNGKLEDIKKLSPHSYQNLSNQITGAALPPSFLGYKSYTVRLGEGRSRGEARLIMETGAAHAYYTNNHYLSFFGVDIDQRP